MTQSNRLTISLASAVAARQGIAQMVEGDAVGLEGRSAEGFAPVREQLLLFLRVSAHQESDSFWTVV